MHARRIGTSLLLLLGLFVAMPLSTVLGVTFGISADGKSFTLDGVPTYLLGQSYYGAQYITTPRFVAQDLDDLAAQKYNWIRVWATWKNEGHDDVSVVAIDGTIRPLYMDRLKTLVKEANQRRMIVEVVVIRNNAKDWIGPQDKAQHLAVVRMLARELLPYRNVYFDVANEYSLGKRHGVSVEDIRDLIAAVKAVDPKRICTASHGGPYKSAAQLNADIKVAGVDCITAHLGRAQGVSALTYEEVRKYIGWMTKRVPVHLNEPFRRGFALRYNPVPEDFYRDNSGAKLAGAAGWCFHNGSNKYKPDMRPYRSFEMTDAEGRLYDQFDKVEAVAVPASIDQIGSTSLDLRRYQVEYPEQIDHVVGRKSDLGWIAEVDKDSAGYMTQGPGLNGVPAGRHRATWRLQIDNPTSDHVVVAVLEMVAGGKVLASRSIKRQEFTAANSWQSLSLDFISAGQQDLGFRTDWTDQANLKIDWIELYISPRLPATSGPADHHHPEQGQAPQPSTDPPSPGA